MLNESAMSKQLYICVYMSIFHSIRNRLHMCTDTFVRMLTKVVYVSKKKKTSQK